jgi:hypothetical protein
MLNYIFGFWILVFFVALPFIFGIKIPGDSYEFSKVFTVIFFISLGTGLFVWSLIFTKNCQIKLCKIHLALVVWILLQFISFAVNGAQKHIWWGQYYRYQGIFLNCLLVFFAFIMSQIHYGIKESNLLRFSIILGNSLLAALVVIQGILYKIFHLQIYNYNGRIAGFMGNPNFTGGLLAICYSFVFMGIKNKYLKMLNFFLFFTALILTGSRSALIAFLTVSFLLFKISIKTYWKLVFTALIISTSFIMTYRDSSPIDNRWQIWQKSIKAVSQKPLFGWGTDNFYEAFYSTLNDSDFNLKNMRVDKAHNEILEITTANGFMGLIVFVWLIASIFKVLWQNRELYIAKSGLLALIAYLIISQLNILNVNEYLMFYLLISLAASMTIHNRQPETTQNIFLKNTKSKIKYNNIYL